jgi:hypothetical protein
MAFVKSTWTRTKRWCSEAAKTVKRKRFGIRVLCHRAWKRVYKLILSRIVISTTKARYEAGRPEFSVKELAPYLTYHRAVNGISTHSLGIYSRCKRQLCAAQRQVALQARAIQAAQKVAGTFVEDAKDLDVISSIFETSMLGV